MELSFKQLKFIPPCPKNLYVLEYVIYEPHISHNELKILVKLNRIVIDIIPKSELHRNRNVSTNRRFPQLAHFSILVPKFPPKFRIGRQWCEHSDLVT